jgi:U3 small nucleolar RNA-associated protein 7
LSLRLQLLLSPTLLLLPGEENTLSSDDHQISQGDPVDSQTAMEDSIATIEKPRARPHPRKPSNGTVVARQARTDLVPKHERIRAQRHRAADAEYGRGSRLNVRGVKDKKLRRTLTTLEDKFKSAAVRAKDAEILHENAPGFLETEHELERTWRVRQDDITQGSAVETAQKRFELNLNEFGPYVFDYSRNGRELLLGGRKGHVATMDWREGTLGCEINLGETVRDVRWLHNNQYFAVAQKKYTYIYDRNGVEIHNMRKLMDVTHMEFLPYHFLLATMVSTHPSFVFAALNRVN